MPRPRPGPRVLAAQFGFFAAAGLLLALLGPFGSYAMPALARTGYWLSCAIGGGGLGVAVELLLARRLPQGWPRTLLSALVMTPLVAVLVVAAGGVFGVHPALPSAPALFLVQVFAISVLVMGARLLLWRDRPAVPHVLVETRTVVEPPLPEAEARFRRRLSAARRHARLIAVQAEDHYLRVHTDAGSELISLRFADALAELARAHGYRTHRSWWVAGDAIERAQFSRGSGELRLTGGLTAPISRTYAATLRDAGHL